MRPFQLTLRSKLALVAVVLLALPWVGYRYVQEMERFLLEGQQQAMLATARAVATALHERPQLMNLESPIGTSAQRTAGNRGTETATTPAVPVDSSEPARPPDAQESGGARSETPPPAEKVEDAPKPGEIARESALREHEGVDEIGRILRGLQRTTSRIWVVNRELRVLALAGSLKQKNAPRGKDAWWRPIIGRLIQQPTENFDDAANLDALVNGRDLSAALLGAPSSRVRNSPDGNVVIVSAAHPIWAGDTVVGAVVVEETTNSVLSVRSRALERLLILTLTVFSFSAVAILWFATRLSNRIRRLRDDAESAIDARGRLKGSFHGSNAGDEIGDLARSFGELLRKVSQHHAYLESLASRLSHELRTPLAVIRSSLENLRMQSVPDEARVYMDRADEGVLRLNRILTRMGEATRLEQSLQTTERERYDLGSLVRECASGYELAYPNQRFVLDLPASPVHVVGQPDLAAQMLDKLVGNAADFATPGTPIGIAVATEDGYALLRVSNQGPRLPEQLKDSLFDSMISVRQSRAGEEPHLGLGLYVARLIAEFHGGGIRADDLDGGIGVAVTAALCLA